MAIIVKPKSFLNNSNNVCLEVDGTSGGWVFGSPRDAYFAFTADVEVNDRPPMPPNLVSGSQWQVGYIQNVLSETIKLKYDNMNPISLSVSTPCLDALPGNAPWVCGRVNNVRHVGQVQGFNSFSYQSPGKPVRFRISMADWPQFLVFNFFGGGSYPRNAGSQVRSVECIRRFRTWIAAREEISPSNLASSYILLYMIDVAFKGTIILEPNGANPLFMAEYRAANIGTNQRTTFAGISVDAKFGIVNKSKFSQPPLFRWEEASQHTQPVIVPPFANEFYPPQLRAQNSSVVPQWLSLTTATRCL